MELGYRDKTKYERDEFGNLVPVAREEWDENEAGTKTVTTIPLNTEGNPIEEESEN